MKKVSMIIPCYNVKEHALNRMLNSVLSQNYSNIEVIMVDDGSTDDTLERITKWADIFKGRNGYTAKVFSKPNGGIASAVNAGLANFTGDYICFPDADDILSKDYVWIMANYLNTNPNLGWVRCFGNIVDEGNLNESISRIELPNEFDSSNIFLEYLLLRLNPVVWLMMVRSDFLKRCIPNLRLYENHGPQEWQLVLPLSFNGDCGHVKKELYTHINYSTSHFHKALRSIESYRIHMELDQESKRHTLSSLPIENRQLYEDVSSLGYICALRQRFEDQNAYICASELNRLYGIYSKNPHTIPAIDKLYKKNIFFHCATILMRFFLSLEGAKRYVG